MVKTKTEKDKDGKKQHLVWCDLPAGICKNKKSRQFWSRGGLFIERAKSYAPYTDKDSFVFSHPKFDRPLSPYLLQILGKFDAVFRFRPIG